MNEKWIKDPRPAGRGRESATQQLEVPKGSVLWSDESVARGRGV